MTDSGLLGAIVAKVVSTSPSGTKVLFVTKHAATDSARSFVSDVAQRAGLAEWAGWALVSLEDKPRLDITLDDLAETGRCREALIVGVEGLVVEPLPPRSDDLEVAVLEVG